MGRTRSRGFGARARQRRPGCAEAEPGSRGLARGCAASRWVCRGGTRFARVGPRLRCVPLGVPGPNPVRAGWPEVALRPAGCAGAEPGSGGLARGCAASRWVCRGRTRFARVVSCSRRLQPARIGRNPRGCGCEARCRPQTSSAGPSAGASRSVSSRVRGARQTSPAHHAVVRVEDRLHRTERAAATSFFNSSRSARE